MMNNMKMCVILGIMFAGCLVSSNKDCYAASLTCEEGVLNDLCKEAPETVPHDPEANPRKECFTKGKRICLENYFSGFPQCFQGDGTNGYAVLNVADRLTSRSGGPWYCDTTVSALKPTAQQITSADWKGNNKWYRFGESGTGKLASQGLFPIKGKCGTNIGGYSLSNLPKACETRDITVCFDGNSQCSISKPAKATNCGSFYVYQLPEVSYCSLRYCSEL